MAEENKHPPTTEEQTPPEMPGKAPKMEQAEIPDVGGGPAPSAKVIDLSAMRSTPEKDAPPDIPKETEAPSVSVTEYSKREWEKPMPEPEKPKPKRGRPAKAEKATPTEPGAKKEVKAEKPRRGHPPKTEKTAPEQTKPPKAGKTHDGAGIAVYDIGKLLLRHPFGFSLALDLQPYVMEIKLALVAFKLHIITLYHSIFQVIVFERLTISCNRMFRFVSYRVLEYSLALY